MMHNPLLISVQRIAYSEQRTANSVQRIVDSEQRTESSLLTHKLQRYVFFRTFCANQMQKACFLLRSAKFVEHLRKPSAMMLAPIAAEIIENLRPLGGNLAESYSKSHSGRMK